MDGTLVDSLPSHLVAWKSTCDFYNLPYDPNYILSHSGMPTVVIAEKIQSLVNSNHDCTAIADFKYEAWKSSFEAINLIPMTSEIFYQYFEHKLLAVGTGAKRESAELILGSLGILENLAALVTASDVSLGKPAGETFTKAAEMMSVEAHECIVFEDTLIGLEAAKNAKMDCYLLRANTLEFHPFST